MKRYLANRRNVLTAAACVVLILALAAIGLSGLGSGSRGDVSETDPKPEATDSNAAPAASDDKPASASPAVDQFLPVAESEFLSLKANAATGHFIVTDKRTGYEWKSFPDESGYDEQQNQGKWKANLASPIMFSYVEMNVRRDLVKETNLPDEKGTVAAFEATDRGFKLRFDIPGLGFEIPVEVSLGSDYVETKIKKEGLRDEKAYTEEELKAKKDKGARLVSVKLYPFLGAHTSEGDKGYLLLPDGPGALVEFKKDRGGTNNFYSERVYGSDWAYSANSKFSIREPVRMPVFGIKAGGKAMLGVIRDGSEYANVVAAPSRTFSQYNWVTAEQQFRFLSYQYTNTKKTEGFFTYTKDMAVSDRSVRYYFIGQTDAGYVHMASKYRQFLMDEAGLRKLQAEDKPLELQLHVFGADSERGFLWDSYLPLTTTQEAQEIVQELNGAGIERMSVTYLGWQREGFSRYGGSFPIARKLGGNEGMRQLADFLHAKGYSLYLDASSYSFNNTGKEGFRKNRDGLRDIGASVMEYRGGRTLVSPRFAEKVISGDLLKAKDLHVDGLMLGQAIGSILNTDFNDNYAATRDESKRIQERIFAAANDTLGSARVDDGNAYALKYVNHVHGLTDEISNDLFVDRQVPFAQIALHGLVPYSADYVNESEDYEIALLRSIEYGAVPSFVVTYAPSQQLLKTTSLGQFFSTHYKDWVPEIVSQYQQANEALGDVQDEFITGHRMLADGVFETTYESGKRVAVNYNDEPYTGSGWTVGPKSFAVLE
ncbi:DUF5696 domain-containing protein [Paenibacillus thermotolerans]|uniref:DUF5696 domain-containing protein n=1 Tax=Paenibacillus thermotolerans TaxID=3027807 RepID=UPI002368820C|nr:MULTISPECIES: DUF5696 domain-containing protein [unclassified Paenibacillus]